ncbi:MAG: pyruvate, phosphate dikinase [Candidatus Nitrosothermus koennekii]|nr:MAG: pyruvate, phosphate dikinase [Candidatus Nitrosothermus koennekii]
MQKVKRIVFFEEGDGRDKRLLGGKGAGLAEMTRLGLPVPPGFVITTEVCNEYYANNQRLPEGLEEEVREAIKRLEEKTGKRFGDTNNPLLVSVRSGAPISMPGMMDTILNLGLNDQTVEALAKASNNPRFAYDAYRRFIQMFGKIVLNIDDKIFSDLLEAKKREKGVKYDHELDVEALKDLVNKFKKVCEEHTGKPFPSDPYQQLMLAIEAVFKSWMGERAVEYRKYYKITPDIAHGTAVNVVTMVFGNMGDDSGTGVVFTRNPETGEKKIYGEFLRNAQGEDVVAGVRTPEPIDKLKEIMPDVYNQLLEICEKLEKHYREPQDVEFTVERGKLYMLQTRAAKMNAPAMVKTSVDMVKEGLIDKKRAIKRINVDQIETLLHKRVDPKSDAKPIAKGIAASPGAATGIVVLDTKRALELGNNGNKVILVREETKPEDVPAFFKSVGVLTSRGGKTSHAAVVARGMGLPCIVGCSEITIDEENRLFKVNDVIVKEGDIITIDGTSGNVFLGTVKLIEPEITEEFKQLLAWAEELKRLGVRANADTPEAAKIARDYGAKGIGLCRTERMFNASDRLPIFVRMILADNREDREKYLKELARFIKEDAKEILKVMEGYPVTIRLLDPPLHEFLPRMDELDQYSDIPKEQIIKRYKELEEVNPMMGHRGVRLGITYPEIYEYQIRAILEATKELLKERVKAVPQIMVPQVGSVEEFRVIKDIFRRVKNEVDDTLDVKFGTMMEVVRACMTADQLAEEAEFFSFGTNDLTQAVFSFSREDVEGKFLLLYLEKGILKDNPFQTLDKDGVGKVMDIAIKDGRAVNKELEIGICGEHGGDPRSIELCHKLGLDYVSASPHRIPIAILAAAQSAIKE